MFPSYWSCLQTIAPVLPVAHLVEGGLCFPNTSKGGPSHVIVLSYPPAVTAGGNCQLSNTGSELSSFRSRPWWQRMTGAILCWSWAEVSHPGQRPDWVRVDWLSSGTIFSSLPETSPLFSPLSDHIICIQLSSCTKLSTWNNRIRDSLSAAISTCHFLRCVCVGAGGPNTESSVVCVDFLAHTKSLFWIESVESLTLSSMPGFFFSLLIAKAMKATAISVKLMRREKGQKEASEASPSSLEFLLPRQLAPPPPTINDRVLLFSVGSLGPVWADPLASPLCFLRVCRMNLNRHQGNCKHGFCIVFFAVNLIWFKKVVQNCKHKFACENTSPKYQISTVPRKRKVDVEGNIFFKAGRGRAELKFRSPANTTESIREEGKGFANFQHSKFKQHYCAKVGLSDKLSNLSQRTGK